MPTINFKGKNSIVNYHLTTAFHELKPDKKKSLLPRGQEPTINGNMLINGDNLLALKALMPVYAGKVNCIYIDPPYNTGNEKWCYNDRVNNAMMREWLNKAVDRDDLTRHDKWCCMMYPRLSLLRELLAEDGVIFVSIDDNEQHHLRLLMDEIFGEDDFVGNIGWESKTKTQNTKAAYNKLQPKIEHILCYSKKSNKRFNLFSIGTKEYPEKDKKGKFRYYRIESMSDFGIRGRLSLVFPILGVLPAKGNQWKIGQNTVKQYQDRGDLKLIKGEPYLKMRPEDEIEDIYKPFWGFLSKDEGTGETAKRALSVIMGKSHGFETVKPVNIIKQLIFHASNKNAIILDSFAGSGTTAQAVLELNKEDGGNRKFILVECEDYADKITAERIKRVSKGVAAAKDENLKNGLGGEFSYWTLGEALKLKSILEGGSLPDYKELAAYLFYTTTGENWNARNMRKKDYFIGETAHNEIYLFYQPDIEYLKQTSLTLEMADKLPKTKNGKQRLVFAPTRYIKTDELEKRRIKFCQLPYEIYRKAEKKK